MNQSKKGSQVIREAIQVIKRNGWHQGYYYDLERPNPAKGCPVCAFGAVNIVLTGHPAEPSLTRKGAGYITALDVIEGFLQSLEELNEEDLLPFTVWQDKQGRTVGQVLDRMERAAQILEEEGR